jgi:hypothetical protein
MMAPVLRGVWCIAMGAAILLVPGAAWTQATAQKSGKSTERALREMQIYKIKELGLEIWVENQPPWEVQLSKQTGHPTFLAQSPDNYHPPTVMSFASWPQQKVAAGQFRDVAFSAIRRASQNFGVSLGQSRGIHPLEASYGVLRGYEATFYGKVDGVSVDVTVFVGQAEGKFPVALSMYTLRDKMDILSEQRRRSWTKLKYL